MAQKPVIGLLGGGQLGRMLQEAASPLGIEIVVLDAADCPFRQISSNPKHVTGSFNDPEKIRELARRCDVLTVEIEHVNTEVLEEIATKGVMMDSGHLKKVQVHPSWETLHLIRDKYLQKEHFARAGLGIAAQMAVDGSIPLPVALQAVGNRLGFPFMLKARKGSYDGRGNMKISGPEDFAKATESMGDISLYAEKWVEFVRELAVMVVRSEDSYGKVRELHTYPAVETVHEDSICTRVSYPLKGVPFKAISDKAKKIATDTVQTLKGRGVFAVEMFLLRNGTIYVNEVAPRPHNSGHLFIEAVPWMSQFKAQLYSILDIFPHTTRLEPRIQSALMINILGGANEESHHRLVDLANSLSDDTTDIFLHLYGKASRPGRKIGHITTIGHERHLIDQEPNRSLMNEVDSVNKERRKAASTSVHPSQAPKHQAPQPTTSHIPNPSPPNSASSRSTEHPLVVVTMGSDSDLPILKSAFEILERFHVPYDFTVTSAHRTPHRMVELGKSAVSRGIRVFIAAAGGAAHLPGMLASETTVPVIGVPIKATHLDGNDSLLSIVQMPRGCPVATVGINNSTNAALLAIKILGSHDDSYRDAMAEYMKNMSDEVEIKADRLRDIGWKQYLDEK